MGDPSRLPILLGCVDAVMCVRDVCVCLCQSMDGAANGWKDPLLCDDDGTAGRMERPSAHPHCVEVRRQQTAVNDGCRGGYVGERSTQS